MVDVKFKSRLSHFVGLSTLKHLKSLSYKDIQEEKDPEATSNTLKIQYLSEEELSAIKEMPLLTQGRLSVQPVSELAFQGIRKLGENGGWENGNVPKTSAPKTEKKKVGKRGSKRKADDADTEEELGDDDTRSAEPEPAPSRAKKTRQSAPRPETVRPTRQSSRKKP